MDIEKINSREFAKRVVNYNTDIKIQGELQEIHLKLFKRNFKVNCGNCIKQAYVDIRAKLNESQTKQIKKIMSEFELKKGINGDSKQIHFEHDIITNDNITDEYAKRILKKMPGHIITFSKFPANWRELVFGKAQIIPDVKPEDYGKMNGDLIPKETIKVFTPKITLKKKGKK